MNRQLSADGWRSVGLHLKPRHLFRLLLTCKAVKTHVDNEHYWTRVAAHLVWRGCEWLELHSREFPEDTDVLAPMPESNLYYMIGLDRGYYWGMEKFLQRIQEVMEFHGMSGESQDEDVPWIKEIMALPSLRERTIKYYMDSAENRHGVYHTCNEDRWLSRIPRLRGDEAGISMKVLAKRLTHEDWVKGKKTASKMKMKDFVCRLEDYDMPAKYKQLFSRELSNLIWGMITVDGVKLSPTEMALNVCLF